MRIALPEDGPLQGEVIVQTLSQSGHDVVTYTDDSTLPRTSGRSSCDIPTLDWCTSGMFGIDVLSVARSRHKDVSPVLSVTTEEGEKSLVRASTYGAGDYIAKSFHITKLCARVDALLRRTYSTPYGRLSFAVGPHHFNPQRQQVTLHSEPVTLTGIEFQLALLLFSNVGRTLSRDHIFGQVQGRNSSEYTRTIDSHVSRIRMKLNVGPVNEVRLAMVYKHGYWVDHPRPADDMNVLSDMDAALYST